MGTALIPLALPRVETSARLTDRRANAEFVAHLIAMAARAPQTRQRRRVEPEAGLAAYRALGHRPTLPGSAVSRSL